MSTATARNHVQPSGGSTRHEIEFAAGVIDYSDPGGDGPTIVLLHGLLMDASLWDDVVGELSLDHRCVPPTLPLGSHRHGTTADPDLSLEGLAGLAQELIESLDLHVLPQGRLVEVADSYTLITLEQPARPAELIREFRHSQYRPAA